MVRITLFLALVCLWNAALISPVYRSYMQIGFRYFPFWRDEAALFGALLLMTVLVISPAALIALCLSWNGYRRASRAIAGGWAFLASLFFLTDAASISTSGSHLTHYLTYVRDILAHPEIEGLEMIGGAWGLAQLSLMVLAGVGTGVVLSALAAGRLTREQSSARRSIAVAACALIALPLSQALWSDYVVSSMSYQRLAVPLPLFPELDQARSSRGVRIVEATHSLLSNDKVVLRNYGAAQDLDGWELMTRKARIPLSGTLAAGRELEVSIDLDARTEWVALLDQASSQRDSLQYTPASAGWATSLPYRRDRVVEFEPAVAALQQCLRQAVTRAVPSDPGPRIRNKKHVVILVFESFRRDAVGARNTPHLAAWSARGTALRKHMSGANGTHLGLYSLLYSRAALFYRRDLDAEIPPQLTETFRLSGYRTTYLSSATSLGWMWMERMLSDRAFHSIEFGNQQRTVSGWNAWPVKDEEFFREVPRRLREAREPQLIVLRAMSTHFPYAFPATFDRHKPSLGESQDSRVLSRATPAVLKNRYANSVQYLDHLFGQMMKELDLKNTVVIVTGDHGESIWDDGDVSHGTRASEVQLAVPCLIAGAGVPSRTLSQPTYHADLLPTLLHLLNGETSSIKGSHGADLMEPLRRDSIPVVPVVGWPPYALLLVGPDARLKFDISSEEWLSGRRDLGVLDPALEVSFAGDVRPDGLLAGNLPRSLNFSVWNQRLAYWTKLLSQ